MKFDYVCKLNSTLFCVKKFSICTEVIADLSSPKSSRKKIPLGDPDHRAWTVRVKIGKVKTVSQENKAGHLKNVSIFNETV